MPIRLAIGDMRVTSAIARYRGDNAVDERTLILSVQDAVFAVRLRLKTALAQMLAIVQFDRNHTARDAEEFGPQQPSNGAGIMDCRGMTGLACKLYQLDKQVAVWI